MSGKKEYDLNMRRISTKSSRLASAVKALHEGVKEEEKYAMMDRLMANIENYSREDLEATASRIEKNIEERKTLNTESYMAPDGSGRSISPEEYAKELKAWTADHHNR